MFGARENMNYVHINLKHSGPDMNYDPRSECYSVVWSNELQILTLQ